MARQRKQRGQAGGAQGSSSLGPAFNASAARTEAEALKLEKEWLDKVKDAENALIAKMREHEKASRNVAGAVGLAKAALTGWVTAGLAGTVQGQQLAVQFTFLNREIASIFLPVVERATQALRGLVQHFRSLTGTQQETIGRTVQAALAFGTMLTIAPKLTGALGGLGGSLKTVLLANPLLALAAGLVAVLSLTDRGRQSLSSIGSNLLKAFQPVADFLADVILPALEDLSEFLATAGGQVVAATGLFLLAVPKIISGIVAIGGAFKSMTGALGLAAVALGLLLTLFGKSRFDKQVDDIAKAVRTGKKSIQEARDEVKRLAEEAGLEAEEAARGHRTLSEQGLGIGRQLQGLFGEQTPEEIAEQVRRELEERGLARLERAGRGRRDVEPSRVGFEDPRETIRRLQAAALKVDPIPGKQLDVQRDILQIMKQLREKGFILRPDEPAAGA
jgi:Sec-independent protein translocase protein TatA